MQTTLYNHVSLGTQDKPLITNLDFKQTLERIEAGDFEAYNEALSKYSFEPVQRQMLQDKINLHKHGINCYI